MKIGTYYCPEQWPRTQWERDFDNIARMGLQVVHLGEFAWFSMEPAEGDIRLDWLNDCVEMAANHRLDVILCTPTAVPPAWMLARYPEILLQTEDGESRREDGRLHSSPTSPALHDATRRIVTALVDRFGRHPAITGWQINTGYSASFGQNNHTHAAFREWLHARYQTLDGLNAAWVTPFRNTQYTDWSQIMFPPRRELSFDNPHQKLDASRFWSWTYAQFNKLQADIIKAGTEPPAEPRTSRRAGGKSGAAAKAGATPFITTNFVGLHAGLNPADFANNLSLCAWDGQSISGQVKNPPDETYRLADPWTIAFTHDWMASQTGRWGMLKLQPGQFDWTGSPVLPYPGAIRLWLWTALAHGADFTTVYRYRQAQSGTEQWQPGLVGLDGVSPSPGGREFMRTIEEIRLLDPVRLNAPTPAPVPSAANTEAAILFSHEDLSSFDTFPHARRWDQRQWLFRWYAALARLGWRVRILRSDAPLDSRRFKMVIVPGMQMTDEATVARWTEYVNTGGRLMLTCRTGIMDRNGRFPEGPYGKMILPLIGGTIDAYDSLPDGRFGNVEMDERPHLWGVWGDILFAEEQTKVIARYADQFYHGGAAVIGRRVGQGAVGYCGVHAEQPFIDALIERFADAARLPITNLPDRVHLLRRGAYHILLNYQDKPVTAPAAKNAHFVIGQRKVDPASVAVWEE